MKNKEIWFVTGSQHLYGPDTLKQVAADSLKIASALDKSPKISHKVVFKPVLTTPDSITELCAEANNSKSCIGLITWMHTFSPAKMWIRGLSILNKPFLHFHTQLNRDIPWESIDMNFMNLNQSAHGDREFGFIGARMRLSRKVVVGHYQDPEAVDRIAVWIRAASAFDDAINMKVARFGDNMRDVAVTEGNKVSAQMKMGYSVYGFGIGDLVKSVNEVSPAAIKKLLAEYGSDYKLTKAVAASDTLKEAARIELGMEAFLNAGNFKAFTTTFEDLHGLKQLPGLAVQRLMAKGYGFGAEGDWKTAALVRTMWVMAQGLPGGCSFLEDYTLNFDGAKSSILQAHMLEINPEIAAKKPRLEVHYLGIGDSGTRARLVFTAHEGAGIACTIVDMGNRFRMIANTVEVIKPKALPKLPVACALWIPQPNFEVGAGAWITAGGTHHSSFSFALTPEYIEDYAEIADIELLVIDKDTTIRNFKQDIRNNEVYYMLNKALR